MIDFEAFEDPVEPMPKMEDGTAVELDNAFSVRPRQRPVSINFFYACMLASAGGTFGRLPRPRRDEPNNSCLSYRALKLLLRANDLHLRSDLVAEKLVELGLLAREDYEDILRLDHPHVAFDREREAYLALLSTIVRLDFETLADYQAWLTETLKDCPF